MRTMSSAIRTMEFAISQRPVRRPMRSSWAARVSSFSMADRNWAISVAIWPSLAFCSLRDSRTAVWSASIRVQPDLSSSARVLSVLSLSLRELRYASAIGISRAKCGSNSKSILGHMGLVYFLREHLLHGGGTPAPAQEDDRDTGQQNGCDDDLRPDAVDAPHLDDVCLHIRKHRRAE